MLLRKFQTCFSPPVLWWLTHCQKNVVILRCTWQRKKTARLISLLGCKPNSQLSERQQGKLVFFVCFYRSTIKETGTATRWLAFRKSASSHEPLFFHIWRRADGWSLSSFLLLTTVKWSPSLFVISQIEQATQKHLVDKGPCNLRDELIRQCLHCCAHKGNIICSQLVAFYQCSIMTRQIVPE